MATGSGGKRSVAKGSASRAVRQPGMAATTIRKTTDAGSTGNVADGRGPVSNRMLSGAEDGSTGRNNMGTGTP